MSTPDIINDINLCEQRIVGIPELLSLLRDHEFIWRKMAKVKVVFSSGNPSLGLALSQLYVLIRNDDRVKDIIRRECEENFENDRIFPFFILFCTVFLYSEYVRVGESEESGGEG